MRPRVALLALLLLAVAVPAKAAGTVGCATDAPGGTIALVDGCSVTFFSEAGTIVIRIEAFTGTVGSARIHGDGPANSQIFWECALAGASAVCAPAISIFAPARGTWEISLDAVTANTATFNPNVFLSVTYP